MDNFSEKIYDTVIVGGGASGLACALELGFLGKGKSTLVLERNDRAGKKLLATGNGQGNLCNRNFSEEFYHGERSFVKKFCEHARSVNIEKYLYRLGIPLYVSQDGKEYPASRQASSVLDIMREKLTEFGTRTVTSFFVKDIKEKGGTFFLTDGERTVRGKTVVLSFGGKAGNGFGTDGSSYALAEKFGHKTTSLFPSLVQLKTEKEPVRGLENVKELATVRAYDGERFIKEFTGDLLFTDYGVSGNSVFALSGYLCGAKNPILRIRFLPWLTDEEALKVIKDKLACNVTEENGALCGVVHKRLGKAIMKRAGSRNPNAVFESVRNFTLNVTGDNGFKNAQVTRGGIDVNGVDPDNFESRLKKGLFITGEALDIDGDCGGYNLTFALVSGIVVARSIAINDKI